jgi:hypothetical protein
MRVLVNPSTEPGGSTAIGPADGMGLRHAGQMNSPSAVRAWMLDGADSGIDPRRPYHTARRTLSRSGRFAERCAMRYFFAVTRETTGAAS